jgi:hypothetical protein
MFFSHLKSTVPQQICRHHDVLGIADRDRRRSYRPRKICVDITAGNKMSSIAGAIVTLNRDLMVSYVNNEGEYSVYQARIGLADSLTRSLSG